MSESERDVSLIAESLPRDHAVALSSLEPNEVTVWPLSFDMEDILTHLSCDVTLPVFFTLLEEPQ